MKRLVLKVMLFLLLGAIVNVAVAWGCLRISCDFNHVNFDDDANDLWAFDRPADWPPEPDRGARYCRMGVNQRWSVYEWRGAHGSFCAMDCQYGFPLVSMRCSKWYVEDDKLKTLIRYDWGWHARQSNDQELLPLLPMWPGFAINTLFYAVVLWLLFAGPFALRRQRRIKRGLCPACAYPVGASPVCSECGGALPHARGPRASLQFRP